MKTLEIGEIYKIKRDFYFYTCQKKWTKEFLQKDMNIICVGKSISGNTILVYHFFVNNKIYYLEDYYVTTNRSVIGKLNYEN